MEEIDPNQLNEAKNSLDRLLLLLELTEESEKSKRIIERELNFCSESLHIVNGKAEILWANIKELEGLGYNPEDYIGESIIDFHVDGIVINDMLNILLSGEELQNYPARVKAKDGSHIYVLINSSGFFDEDGSFSHTRCFSRVMNNTIDITEMIEKNIERIKKENNKKA